MSRAAIVAVVLLGCGARRGGASDDTGSGTTTTPGTGMGTGTGTGMNESSIAGETTRDASSSDGADTSTGMPPDGPPSIARIGATFVIPTLAASQPKRFADTAHDPIGDVYLVANGNAATSGCFLDAEGTPLGEPFAIAETDAYTQGVRVGFGGDAFLVAWHDNRDVPDQARLRARRVAWDGSAPVLGTDVEIGDGPSFHEMPPAIAFSETSAVFLVAWHTVVGDDIHAQRVDADGARVGAPIVLTADADWQSDVGLAWNPERDEWLAVYTHAGATIEVRARTIAADGTLGSETSLTTAAGTWLTHAAWVPARSEYLVAWFEGRIAARRVAADGTPAGEIFEIAPGYGSYDGFAMAYNPVTATFAAVFHGTSDEDFAVAFDALGTQSEVIEATMSRGADGNFNPHVAAHGSRDEWLLVTSRGFAEVVGQRLGR